MTPEPHPGPPPEGPSSDFDPLDAPAEEFLARLRHGERPALSEYEQRYPDLAGRIRALFPALVEMEQAGTLPADGPTRPVAVDAPAWVGEFRILRKVGEGGMGVVYEALQQSLGRHVALKVLPPSRRGNYLDRFRREARAAARLHHTNIVPVFGVGEADGLHYYAMQFIAGQGLDSVLDEVRRLRAARSSGVTRPAEQTRSALAHSVAESLVAGRYPPSAVTPAGPVPAAPASQDSRVELASQPDARYYREVARIGAQVAEALAYAHGQGVLHRDIKPSNLLLDLHGTAWVTDFGLAKADNEQDLTQTGDIIGTLRYMAPERFQGKADARSEVYALGVTLYELLTLHPAFEAADRVALIERVCHAAPPRPRKLDRQIPRDLETIVLKAMAREPDDRYQTAAALAEDLRRFLSDRTILARRATVAEQLRRWARRNKAVASLMTVLFVASVTAAVVFAVQRENLRVALKDSENDRKALTISQGEAVRQAREARLKQLDSMLAEARAKTLSRAPGQRFESLALLDQAQALVRELDVGPEKVADMRNAYAASLSLPDFHRARELEYPSGSKSFDFNDDHTVFARTLEDGTCVVVRVADNTEICRVQGPPPKPGIGWTLPWLSGDGRTLMLCAWGGEAQVWRIGPSPERIVKVLEVYRCDLRRDGQRAVFTHLDGSVSVYDLTADRPPVQFPAKGSTTWLPHLHPSEPRVVLTSPAGALVCDTTTGKVLAPLPGATLSAAWHPDGKTLVLSDAYEIRVYDIPLDTQMGPLYTQMAAWPLGGLMSLRFNPAGNRLACVRWDSSLCLVDTLAGRVVHHSPRFRDGSTNRWSPDGRRLAGSAADGRVVIWEVGDAREFRAFHRLPAAGPYTRTAVHPGSRLVAARAGTGVTFWDLETGRQVADLPFGTTDCWKPVFEPNGGAVWTPLGDRTFRWRLREVPDRPGRFTLGPPEPMPIPTGYLERSADAKLWLVAAQGRPHAYIWRPDRPHDREQLATGGAQGGGADVSPDGRWAVISDMALNTADLWDLRTKERVRRLYTHAWTGDAEPRFSPCGKWLWVNSDASRLLHVGTWEPGPVTGHGEDRPAFTADGRVIALESGSGSVRLVETATGKELVRLDNPHRDTLSMLEFTPDGRWLVGCSNGNTPGVHVWDLWLIRRQLAERGLDWDTTPLPAPAPQSSVTVDVVREEWLEPKKVGEGSHIRAGRWERVVQAPLPAIPAYRLATLLYRSVAYDQLGRHAEADADRKLLSDTYFDVAAAYARYADRHSEHGPHVRVLVLALRESAARLCPDDPLAANNLARALVTGPARYHDAARAAPLGQKAVAADQNNAAFRNTLGCAYYRLGKYPEAIAQLNASLRLSQERTHAADRYLLAMCHLKLGNTVRAYFEFALAANIHWRWRRALHPIEFAEHAALAEEATFTLFVPPPR